jgi:hypothetical protein
MRAGRRRVQDDKDVWVIREEKAPSLNPKRVKSSKLSAISWVNYVTVRGALTDDYWERLIKQKYAWGDLINEERDSWELTLVSRAVEVEKDTEGRWTLYTEITG